MSQELITYSAQKVKVKALRGQKFELVVTIKNSDGSAYDFTDTITTGAADAEITVTDPGYFQVFGSSGLALQNEYSGQVVSEAVEWDVRVGGTDGKLTITSTNDSGFWPKPGTYKYSLFTERVEATSSELDYWLHGDFVVIDDNPATNLGGVPTTGGLSD